MLRCALYNLDRAEFLTTETYASTAAARLAARSRPDDCRLIDFVVPAEEPVAATAITPDWAGTWGCALMLPVVGLSAGVSLGLIAFLVRAAWRLASW